MYRLEDCGILLEKKIDLRKELLIRNSKACNLLFGRCCMCTAWYCVYRPVDSLLPPIEIHLSVQNATYSICDDKKKMISMHH